MQACDTLRVQALLDGEIEGAAADEVRAHLGHCPSCQDTLEEGLLIDTMAEAHGLPPSVTAVRARLAQRYLLVTTAVALAAGVALWWWPGDRSSGTNAVFATLSSQPRYHEWRLAYPAADGYRRYEGPRAAGDRGRPLLIDLAAIERSGDMRTLATAQLLIGMEKQAAAHLQNLPEDADVLNDRAAAALATGGATRLDEAARLLDRALTIRPDHPQALWNRAVVFDRKGDAAEAVRLFRRVADRGEPGWSAEARARAGGQQLGR